MRTVDGCPTERVVRIVVQVRCSLDEHAATCGDRVVAVALNPSDHETLRLAELWGLPVLGWAEVAQGRYTLVCERNGVLVPRVDTFEELVEHWAYDLQRPTTQTG